MRRIIKNKIYDTETAKEICQSYEISSISAAYWNIEMLYQKRTGEYFLWRSAAKLKSTENIDVDWVEEIRPMTYDEAKKWAKECVDRETYESIFGAITDDNSVTALTLHLPASLVANLKRDAARAGESISAHVTNLLSRPAK